MIGRMLVEALMWPVIVEVTLVRAEHSTSMTLVVDQHPVGALGPDAAHDLSAKQFARGVRGGVLTTSTFSAVNTASNEPAIAAAA
jgi:hypothetical protein